MYSDLSSVAVMVIYRMIGNPYNQNILKRISILTTHTILMILYYPYILTLSTFPFPKIFFDLKYLFALIQWIMIINFHVIQQFIPTRLFKVLKRTHNVFLKSKFNHKYQSTFFLICSFPYVHPYKFRMSIRINFIKPCGIDLASYRYFSQLSLQGHCGIIKMS